MDYIVLIIGSDANAYYMARCYHEAYGKKGYVLAKSMLPYTHYSNILNLSYDSSIWSEEGFLKAIYSYRSRFPKQKILLVSSNESYAELISKHADTLRRDGFVFNYASNEILSSLMNKETFYKTYQDSCLSLPKTYYYDCKNPSPLPDSLSFPLILKPSNVIRYNHISFEGKNKIYKIESREELEQTVLRICKGGYDDVLILQDFIPGDDSLLYDAVAYVDRNHKVKLLSLAQIGLQEHSKNMVGNAAVLINGYYQHGSPETIEAQMKEFLEGIGYCGFAEFDLKFDTRDGTFKVLEINARQGRSSYYITALGYNPIRLLVDDLLEQKDSEYVFLNQKVLLSFVPKGVAKKYIQNKEFLKEALTLWKKGAVNPIRYSKDRNIMRRLYLIKKHFRYYREYKNAYWKVS